MEAKIARTEESISKLERNLKNRTCLISLKYLAKPNVTPDSTFEREIRYIKQQAEQGLVNALTRLHKRQLDSHKKKLRARSDFLENKSSTVVKRQTLSESHSANKIVNQIIKN